MGDDHFKAQRERADQAISDLETQLRFFEMMQQIGDELQDTTGALKIRSLDDQQTNVLDLCMAPGGYTTTVLKYNPSAQVCGISLPVSQGGHRVHILHGRQDPRVTIEFLDITLLASECGVENIPSDHPDGVIFSKRRPYLGTMFDLVLCDGQNLRTHSRADYREKGEAWRLTCSQLIFALQRIKSGGTLIMLLHRVDHWASVDLLHAFSKFSRLELFKPKKKHAARGSFYMVAQKVQTEHIELKKAVQAWKDEWVTATFGGETGTGSARVSPTAEDILKLIQNFGNDLIVLGRPVWKVQADALRRSSFVK